MPIPLSFPLPDFSLSASLAIISILFNLGKAGIIAGLFLSHTLSVRNVALGFLLASLIELGGGYAYLHRKLRGKLRPVYAPRTYRSFVSESLPQLGVVLFDSALARIDWILLGIFSTTSVTAEYTFAYKFFELSKLPLLILAPVLLTRLSTLTSQSGILPENQKKQINQFVRLKIVLSFCIPIVLACIWTPFIDKLTDGKFGAVNQLNFELLALCVPLHFAVNFLWTLAFVQGKLRTIMYITIISSLLNLGLNAILIPQLGGTGAAIAFLASSIFQVAAYYFTTDQSQLKLHPGGMLWQFALSIASVKAGMYLTGSAYVAAIVAFVVYVTGSIVSGQLPLKQLKALKKN
ncbi:MAG: polysaccharide biosynthesis C-terminal domain-containing protein [Chitinophagaceae bacterium]